jgi:hypothetical protein
LATIRTITKPKVTPLAAVIAMSDFSSP